MITGSVNARREAAIALTVRGPRGYEETFVAVIDTGFNGSLTRSAQAAARLGLRLFGQRRSMLANGRLVPYEVYEAVVL